MNDSIRILRPLFNGFYIVILAILLSVLAAKKYLNYVTPMYESTAYLKLADNHEGVAGANLFKDLDVFASINKIATEIEVIKSKVLIENTLNEINFNLEIYRKGDIQIVELYNNSPITIVAKKLTNKITDKRYSLNLLSKTEFELISPNKVDKKIGTLGEVIEFEGAQYIISLNQPFLSTKKDAKIIDNYEFEFLSNSKLIDKVYENLDVISVEKDVPVVRINYKSNVAEKAALFANTLAENYIKYYINSKYLAANTTLTFLNEEIETSNDKLIASENSIEDYRNDKNIINFKQETETDLRKVSELKIQQTNLKMNLNAIKDLNRYIASGKKNYLELAPNFEAFTDLLSTEMVKNIKKLQSEKKDLLLIYTPENEKVKIVEEKIKDLENYQIESIKNTEKNLQIKYNQISQDIIEAEKVFIGLPDREKKLNILNRDFNLYEKNYNFLNEKRIESEIAKSAKISFHKIITPAEIATKPVSPIRSIIIIIAAFLGMLLSIAGIYIFHFANEKVNDVYTIEKNSSIPIALTTPYIPINENKDRIFQKAAIQLELKEIIKDKAILVISSYDIAKTHLFHSSNLTNAYSSQGLRTLFINATEEIIDLNESVEQLNFSTSKYLNHSKMAFQNEIQEKMKDYDLCIIHNQAINNGNLALLFMSLASHNLIVLDSNKTAKKAILKIELLKEEFQLPKLWLVLNKAGYRPSTLVCIQFLWDKYISKINK